MQNHRRKSPRRDDEPLASGSTINRFLQEFTRREAEKYIEDSEVIFEVRRDQIERIHALNALLSHRPGSKLLTQAVKSYTHDRLELWRSQNLFAESDVYDPQDRSRIVFASLLLD